MGLRDALKAKAKALLGRDEARPAASPTARPEPASMPTVTAARAAASPPATPAVSSPPAPFAPVAPSTAVREGKPGTYAHPGVHGINVAIFRQGGKLYAIDNACAHEDGPIGEGTIDGNCVRCPYHDWQYDFTTGACITDPERKRATYAVKDEAGQIWVGPETSPGSASRGGDHDDGMEVYRQ